MPKVSIPQGTKRAASKSTAGEPSQKSQTLPTPRGTKRDAAEGGDPATTLEGASRGPAGTEPDEIMEICFLQEECTGCSVDAVDFTEVFNPGCFAEQAKTFKLSHGGVYDLRNGWNLSKSSQRQKAWNEIRELDPYLIIGSPMCGPDSNIHNLRPEQVPKELLAEAIDHLKFCCKLFMWQIKRGRKFLFERPWSNKGWDRDCIKQVLSQPGVRRIRCDQCCFGLKSRDELGEGFAQKPTGFMGNCEEILNELDQVCPNRYLPADQHHRHVELLQGRAKACERYPVTLIKAILRGLRKHLGKTTDDGVPKIFSIEPGEMGPNLDEPAEDFSRWRMSQKNKFFDEYTGLELDPKLVRQGRTGEMDFMAELGKRVGCKDGIWDVVPVSVCMERTGKPPIGVRWVEHDKNAGSDPPDVRCRLVVQETKRVTTLDTAADPGAAFASTVPLEALRLMFSHHMSRPNPNLNKDSRDDDYVLMLLDISKAHPHAEPTRELYTKLPAEHPCGGDPRSFEDFSR